MTTEQDLAAILGLPVALKQVRIGGHDINYAVAGSGPPLLLIHGANFGWGAWYPNIPSFARRFTVYAIDLPGAGRSSRIDYRTLDPERDLAGIVLGFLLEVIGRKASIIGCSVGGWLAMQAALREPEYVEKVIVENSVGFADYRSFGDKVIGYYPFARFLAGTILRPGPKTSERFLRGIFYNKHLALRNEFIRYFCETMETSHNLLFISRLTALYRSFVMTPRLADIRQPLLIIWGEEDAIMPIKKNRHNFSLIPGAEVRVIPRAGHVPSLEEPDMFNAAALAFLQPPAALS